MFGLVSTDCSFCGPRPCDTIYGCTIFSFFPQTAVFVVLVPVILYLVVLYVQWGKDYQTAKEVKYMHYHTS